MDKFRTLPLPLNTPIKTDICILALFRQIVFYYELAYQSLKCLKRFFQKLQSLEQFDSLCSII